MINKLPKISAPTWISREKETFRFYRQNRGRERERRVKINTPNDVRRERSG